MGEALRGKSARERWGGERVGAFVERAGDRWRWLAWRGPTLNGGVAADKTNALCAALHLIDPED